MIFADLLWIAAGCVLGGVALMAAAAFLHITSVHTVNTTPDPDPVVWLPCHSTTCAHLTTPHQPSPTGPACRRCGAIATVTTTAPTRRNP